MPYPMSYAQEDPRQDLREHLGQALDILDQVASAGSHARAEEFVRAHRDRLERWRQQHPAASTAERGARHPLLAYDAADAEHCPACEWIDEQHPNLDLCPYHAGRHDGRSD